MEQHTAAAAAVSAAASRPFQSVAPEFKSKPILLNMFIYITNETVSHNDIS